MQPVTRAEWGARPPKRRSTANFDQKSTGHWNGPVLTVGGSMTWDHSRCASLVRGTQNFHMDGRGWSDIAYNYVICPHGYTFEGRGLDVINAANGTNSGNKSSHGVMWLAGDGNAFPVEEKVAFVETVDYIHDKTGVPLGAIPHSDHHSTQCPGDERRNWIRAGMPIDGIVVSPVPPSPYPTIKRGSSGDAVLRVQSIIRDHCGGDITVDGNFGPGTERRVKDVQRLFGLPDDGVVGPKTWDALNYLATLPIPAPPAPSPFGNWPDSDKPNLKLGSKGEVVRYLQAVISQKAGGNISVDGVFGNHTRTRVRDLQKFFGVPNDGVVGPKTWGIVDYLAKA